VIAERLSQNIQKLINGNQSCAKGRNISDNLHRIRNIIDIAVHENRELSLVNIDIEQAFVVHDETSKKYGKIIEYVVIKPDCSCLSEYCICSATDHSFAIMQPFKTAEGRVPGLHHPYVKSFYKTVVASDTDELIAVDINELRMCVLIKCHRNAQQADEVLYVCTMPNGIDKD